MGRALPTSPDHRLRGTRPPLGERAQILRNTAGVVERQRAAGTLLSGAPLGYCPSLLPLGGRVCAGLSARPYFAAHREVMLSLMRLVAHCRDSWVWCLRAPAHMRPPLSDRFLIDYFPRSLEGDPPLLPYARRPPRTPAMKRPARGSTAHPPSGGRRRHTGCTCLEHGVPFCARCRSLGTGISCCCWAGHEGHTGSSAGPSRPRAPPQVTPGRQVLVPEARRAGAAALEPARPASQGLPSLGPPATCQCTAPPRKLGTRPSSALGPDDCRPAKRGRLIGITGRTWEEWGHNQRVGR